MTRNRAQFSPRVISQMIILAICRFAEPTAMTSVTPYLYYMIAHFGVPQEEIAKYVGITFASFSFCQFFTGIWWGRASDRFGRKPMIMLGLSGTLLSLMVFGFSTNLKMAIAARCFSGLVNGNVGILRTMIAEMVPEKELQPRAFSLMPLIWTTGSIVGPVLGGFLADPITNHPGWFSEKPPAFFKKFPFALPNIVASMLFVIGLTTGILFLDETLETMRDKPDAGRRLGGKIIKYFKSRSHHHKDIADETTSLLQSESSSVLDEEISAAAQSQQAPKAQNAPPIRDAFTFQSSINLLVYCFLALHSITFDQMLPVLMAYPPENPENRFLPFKFAGGFGMSSSQVGFFFSIYGVIGLVMQIFIFPPITNRLGALRCLTISCFAFPVIYFLTPFAVVLPEKLQQPAIFALLMVKSMAGIFAFPCSAMLLTNSSPTLRLLGTLNGIAVTLAAMGRAVGPAVGGVTFSLGQRIGYLILPWWILSLATFVGALPVLLLVEGEGFAGDKIATVEQGEREEGEGGTEGPVLK
ncbi:major facilitator superfamily domain-containing protein [Morchella snyderi]|nr:major facilitator superfamily domain-containing protein [Morchella snyderi]